MVFLYSELTPARAGWHNRDLSNSAFPFLLLPFPQQHTNTYRHRLFSKPLSTYRVEFQFYAIQFASLVSLASPPSIFTVRQKVPDLWLGFPKELRSFPESNTLRSFPRTCLCIRPPSKISNITCRSSCKRFARRNLAAYTFDPVAE